MRIAVWLAAALAAIAFARSRASADLVPGGPTYSTKKIAADCYAELDVARLEAASVTSNQKGNPTLVCRDGDACDRDGRENGRCRFDLRACANQQNVEGCTPPATLESFWAQARAKGGELLDLDTPRLAGSACGALLHFVVRIPPDRRDGSGSIRLKATAPAGHPPRRDVDRIKVLCVSATATSPCPRNRGGGPDRLRIATAESGSDLDLGWTGIYMNFGVPAQAALELCLSDCRTTDDTECVASGAVGRGTPNGETFGPPVPLLAGNIPLCAVHRFAETITGTADVGTGAISLRVPLLADLYFTEATEVCPRCSNGRCTSGRDVARSCSIDATVHVAEGFGNKSYGLSRDCRPLGAPVATVAMPLEPLTSGTTELTGPTPCPRGGGPGIDPRANACGEGCGAPCTGDACARMVPDPSDPTRLTCQDHKGGISQACCHDDPSSPCFPLEDGGTLTRTGRADPPLPAAPDPRFPKIGAGALAAVVCHAPSGVLSVDGTLGVPGPAALVLETTQEWTRGPAK